MNLGFLLIYFIIIDMNLKRTYRKAKSNAFLGSEVVVRKREVTGEVLHKLLLACFSRTRATEVFILV